MEANRDKTFTFKFEEYELQALAVGINSVPFSMGPVMQDVLSDFVKLAERLLNNEPGRDPSSNH